MSLSTKLTGNFTKNARKRGDDYYSKGRVMIHEGSQSGLTSGEPWQKEADGSGAGFSQEGHLGLQGKSSMYSQIQSFARTRGTTLVRSIAGPSGVIRY
jgi:hypothetical protein